ncbi:MULTISPECIES: phosphate signaling complex protein PhoU [Heyndrickxia]|uniref:Phosphate-specific transport system accessory protein PhoU n=1 Tax=Heyndrickxia sporothermodurans TaxID=46224 RepID=A0AB37HFX1_9BACI|nr:phosphate signaling complex protein PhoU [Heyndrickxia sporothermodurans]MBL5766737.1 phosphate signaling complex protein PhoU [Heyndrickxia sporothermodurans]MBL5770364.1 phosphate signaling complex protein PhoU [Heyndrickxia sporothermodurans]MBL5774030.1 phosphate signaling complex protein PhoU [Heyndrickxia sporothermodurans]MBL5777676.1 phosphate signaling complex protein PhoU [Heyndrickxia sporothermodurans]MBL5780925.1 phosphate signaling complex protein PhoU [Heyndrickxia sporotherm
MVARRVFEDRLTELHETLMSMGLLVEEAIYKSVTSLVNKNSELALEVVLDDERINEYEVEIEKKCFELIALQQPVGTDLRRIATMLKVATDLERMGDHAVSIAKSTIRLKDETYLKPLIDIPKMAEIVKAMVREVLDAYISLDRDGAVAVSKKDDEIDKYLSMIFMELIEIMQQDSTKVNQALHFLLVAQHLERIGDYVTNVCEWIVYLKTGSLVDLNK